jgi:hypothetical protein
MAHRNRGRGGMAQPGRYTIGSQRRQVVSARRLLDAALVPGGVSGREIAAVTGMVRSRYDDLLRDLGKIYGYEVKFDARASDPLDWIYRLTKTAARRKKSPALGDSGAKATNGVG